MRVLESKVAVIAGGTSGIGAAAARLFAEHGAYVVVAGRRVREGEDLVGNTVGVVIIGSVFFAAARGGYTHAFADSLVELACLAAGVVALSRLLPPQHAPNRPSP